MTIAVVVVRRSSNNDNKSKSGGNNAGDPIVIPDNARYEKDHFIIPKHYSESLSHVLLTRGVIDDRIEKIALEIHEAFGGEPLHLLCILKGSRGFFSKLIEYLNKIHRYSRRVASVKKEPPFYEHYIRLKSYHNTESTGNLHVMSDDLSVLKGKNVLIAEDIIDTGNTLLKYCEHLKAFEPKMVKVTALIEKRTPLNNWVGDGDIIGFTVPNVFIVGYCLDYNESFRDLDHICVMNKFGIEKYAN
jgi:hypoxanthine phosphoribosyltransferase